MAKVQKDSITIEIITPEGERVSITGRDENEVERKIDEYLSEEFPEE